MDAQEQFYGKSDSLHVLNNMVAHLSAQNPSDSEVELRIRDTLWNLYAPKYIALANERNGDYQLAIGQMEQAEKLYKKAVEVRETQDELSKSADGRRDFANLCDKLSNLYWEMGDQQKTLEQMDRARHYYREAIAVREHIYNEQSAEETLEVMALTCEKMRDFLTDSGLKKEAKSYDKKASKARKQLEKSSKK